MKSTLWSLTRSDQLYQTAKSGISRIGNMWKNLKLDWIYSESGSDVGCVGVRVKGRSRCMFVIFAGGRCERGW
jgi:hypothetical protein